MKTATAKTRAKPKKKKNEHLEFWGELGDMLISSYNVNLSSMGSVIKGLKENDAIGWIFTDSSKEALGYVAYRYGTLFASMLMHLLYNLFGTVLIDIESSIMPDWMLGLLIFLCVPLTVVGIVLVYIKTVNTDKKQESKI